MFLKGSKLKRFVITKATLPEEMLSVHSTDMPGIFTIQAFITGTKVFRHMTLPKLPFALVGKNTKWTLPFISNFYNFAIGNF